MAEGKNSGSLLKELFPLTEMIYLNRWGELVDCCGLDFLQKAGTLWRIVRRGVEGRDFKTSGVQIHGFSGYVPQLHDTNHLSSHTHARYGLHHDGQLMLCASISLGAVPTSDCQVVCFKVSSKQIEDFTDISMPLWIKCMTYVTSEMKIKKFS